MSEILSKVSSLFSGMKTDFYKNNDVEELKFSKGTTKFIILTAFFLSSFLIFSLRFCFGSSTVRRVFHIFIAPLYIILLSLSQNYDPSERIFYSFLPFVAGFVFYFPSLFPSNWLSRFFTYLFSHSGQPLSSSLNQDDGNKEKRVIKKSNEKAFLSTPEDILGLFLYGFVTALFCFFFYHIQNVGVLINMFASPIGKVLYKRLLPPNFVNNYLIPYMRDSQRKSLSDKEIYFASTVHKFMEDCYRAIICSLSTAFLMGLLCLCGGDGIASIFKNLFRIKKNNGDVKKVGALPYNQNKTLLGTSLCFFGSMLYLMLFFFIIPQAVYRYFPQLINEGRLPTYIEVDENGNLYHFFGGLMYNSISKINESFAEVLEIGNEAVREKYLRIPMVTSMQKQVVLAYLAKVGLIAAIAESLPIPGSWDNLSIFLITAIGSYAPELTIYTLFIVVLAITLYKRRHFTVGGAIAGSLAVWMNWQMSVVTGLTLISFVVLGILSSNYGRNIKKEKISNDKEIKMGRTAAQVLATAAPSMACYLCYIAIVIYYSFFYKNHLNIVDISNNITPEYLFINYNRFKALEFTAVITHAAALTDTMASELGTVLSKKAPRDILRLSKTVPVGTNGGVTMVGTLCGIFGAFIIGIIYSFSQCLVFVIREAELVVYQSKLAGRKISIIDALTFILFNKSSINFLFMILEMTSVVIIYSLLSCTLDSILGSGLQFTGLDKKKRVTTNVEESVEIIKKRKLLSNTQINFISEIITGVSAYFLALRLFEAEGITEIPTSSS